MAGQPEVSNFDDIVYQWEITDPVQGALGGVANLPLRALTNRTRWLYDQLLALSKGELLPPNVAPLNGPVFTGSARAPNVEPGDDSTLIANTDFVQTAKNGLVTIDVTPGQNITLNQDQYGVAIIVLTGQLSANINIIFPSISHTWQILNVATGSGVATLKTASGTGVSVPQSFNMEIVCNGSSIVPGTSVLPSLYVAGLLSALSGKVTNGFEVGTFISDGLAKVDSLQVTQGANVGGALITGPISSNAGITATTDISTVNGAVRGKSVTATAGNVTATNGSVASTFDVSAGRNMSAGGVIAASGNIQSNAGRLRAAVGARGSGDGNAAIILNDFSQDLNGSNGTCLLPNGLTVKWGFVPGPGAPNGGASATFDGAFNALFSLTLTPANNLGADTNAWLLTTSNSGFTFSVNAANIGVYFIAIGT